MISLQNLKTTVKSKKRLGRGDKNAGRGNKGQLKRSGKTRIGFEGGQKSLIRRTPKFKGYSFKLAKRNVKALSLTVISKNFQDGEEISLTSLKEKGIISRFINKVRIINSGNLNIKPNFTPEIYLTSSVKSLI